MQVVWLIPGYAPAYGFGGPIESSHRMCMALRRASVDVRVVTTDIGTREDDMSVPRNKWTEYEGVPVFYAGRWLRHLLSPTFARVASSEARAADLVHVTAVFDVTVPVSLMASLHTGRKTVLSPRGVLEPWSLAQKSWKKAPTLTLMKPLLSRVDAFHVTSDKEAANLRAIGFDSRIEIIPNATELPHLTGLDEAASEWRTRLQLRDEQPLLVMLGRVHEVKGIDVAIDALALLRSRAVDAVLVVAGPDDAVLRARLAAQARRKGVEGAMRWPGMVTGQAKYALLRAADLLLLPSRQENFGNVVVEALSVETPVLASRESPWQSLEAEGAGRWLPLDSESFANAGLALLKDSAQLAVMGRRGRQLVESRYTWDAAARRMLALYESLLARS